MQELKAYFRREERYEGLQVVFGDNEEMKLKVLDTIEFLKNETDLEPKIFENPSKEHPEKRAIYIEFHDSYDREGEVFFDKLLTKLEIKKCF
jgi:hypothetical protein